MNNAHYDENYYNWQKNMGAFGGWAELVKFEPHITPDMNVIDFGCGGGFLLNNLKCKDKIGIELNDEARKSVDNLGITSYKFTQDVPDNWADCIISNHALEHVNDPLGQLILLKSKLKKGGRIVFAIPCESYKLKYKPNDINYHLFTWSPMNLGNLFNEAGFKVIESKTYFHKWPPRYQQIAKIAGKTMFNLICRMYAHVKTSNVQVKLVAEKV